MMWVVFLLHPQAEQLASYFEPHGVRCRLLHGRMSGEDKQAALEVRGIS